MRIEYENKFSDLLLFNVTHQFLSLRMQSLFLLLFLLVFWGESHDNSLGSAAVTAFAYVLAAWVVQILLLAAVLYSRHNHSILTRHVIEVRDDALLEETRFNKSLFYWPGVVKAVTRPGFVCVYVTAHTAHLVPNRAFASGSQRHDFVALVKAKIRAAAALQLKGEK